MWGSSIKSLGEDGRVKGNSRESEAYCGSKNWDNCRPLVGVIAPRYYSDCDARTSSLYFVGREVENRCILSTS